MPVVTIKRGGGGGTTDPSEVTEEFIPSNDFFILLDGSRFSPVITRLLELENASEEAKITDQCGRTIRNKASNSGWILRAEGVITKEDRPGNLSLSRMKQVGKEEKITVRSGLHNGTLTVSNVLITQENTLHSIETEDTNGREEAVTFSLQLGEEDSEE